MRIFCVAALLAFCLSFVLEVGPLFILGGFVLLYLFGLMFMGVLKRSPKPFADPDPAEHNARPASDGSAPRPPAM